MTSRTLAVEDDTVTPSVGVTHNKPKGNAMKTLPRLAIASSMLVAQLAAHATVSAGHWSASAGNAFPGLDINLSIRIDQTIDGDFTGTFWNYNAQAGTLRYVTTNIDEGSTLFLVKPGDVVSQAMVDAPGVNDLGNGEAAVVVGREFYLGAATSSLSDPGVTWGNIEQRTSFGWALFQAQADGSLKILDSAMAFREAGIVVATLQAVPEPGTWALMGLGLLGLAVVKPRRR